jgi:hypothetical protein
MARGLDSTEGQDVRLDKYGDGLSRQLVGELTRRAIALPLFGASLQPGEGADSIQGTRSADIRHSHGVLLHRRILILARFSSSTYRLVGILEGQPITKKAR